MAPLTCFQMLMMMLKMVMIKMLMKMIKITTSMMMAMKRQRLHSYIS